jgi:hypothetical protein
MPQCLQCNASLPAGAKFCGRCGAAVQASEPGSPLTTPATFAPPSPPPSSPPSAPPANPAWTSDPTQGVGGTEQAQQRGNDQAQQWGTEQARQWGTGSTQQWGAGQAQQWGAQAPAYPGAARQQGSTSGAGIAGGVIAIVGALGIIGACALPVTTNTFGIGSNGGSISLFKELGTGTAWWYLVEPIGVAVLAVLAGVIVMVSRSRVLPVIAAGVLIGFGIQTAFLFLGYWRGFGNGGHAGPAGIVGILAGVLLVAAGLVAGAAVRRT